MSKFTLGDAVPVMLVVPGVYVGGESNPAVDTSNAGFGDFDGIAIFTAANGVATDTQLRILYQHAIASGGPWTTMLGVNPNGPNGPGYSDTLGTVNYVVESYAFDMSATKRWIRAQIENTNSGATGLDISVVMQAFKKVSG